MKHLGHHCEAILVLLALSAMLGCQGVSVGKPATQTPASLGQLGAPASVSFGSVQMGTTQSQAETLTNTGGASLTISQASATGSGFSISGLTAPLTLAAGQSTSFSVTFAPKSAGNYSGNITVTSDALDPSATIPLTGSATAQAGQLSVSGVSVGNVTIGTSGSKTGTLTASGASVVVSSVGMSGTNPSEFSVSGISFPATVSTSQPLTFTVTFAPQASGGASANASFASNASNSPGQASLTGTGVASASHSVSLSWNPSNSPNIVSYNVYRAAYTAACGSYSKIGSSASTTYTDSGVANGHAYCYETTAVNSSDQESADSSPVQNVSIPSS